GPAPRRWRTTRPGGRSLRQQPEPRRRLERDGEREAAVGDAVAEQLLRARDALEAGMAGGADPRRRRGAGGALAEVDAQGPAQARVRPPRAGERPERLDDEAPQALLVAAEQRDDLDVAVGDEPVGRRVADDEPLGGERLLVALPEAGRAL